MYNAVQSSKPALEMCVGQSSNISLPPRVPLSFPFMSISETVSSHLTIQLQTTSYLSGKIRMPVSKQWRNCTIQPVNSIVRVGGEYHLKTQIGSGSFGACPRSHV